MVSSNKPTNLIMLAGPRSANTAVTYQPGGSQNDFWVYNDFPTLVGFISGEVNVAQWTILIDASFAGGVATIPAGTYALPSSVNFEGVADSSDTDGYPELTGTGVNFTGVDALTFTNLPSVEFDNSTPLLTFSTGTSNIVLSNANLIPDGTAPLFAVTSGAIVHMIMLEGSVIGTQSGAPQPIASVDGTSTLNIELYDTTEIRAGAISVASGGKLNIGQVDSAIVDRSFRRVPGVTIALQSNARAVAYSPSRRSRADPHDVAAALDELSASVARLERDLRRCCQKRCRKRRCGCRRNRREKRHSEQRSDSSRSFSRRSTRRSS
jgi:hypothetical protein